MTDGQTTGAPQGQDEADAIEEAGRAAVRDRFVRRLAEAGVRPPKGQTAAQHDAVMERLVGHLAYMAADVLDVLAEQVIAHCLQSRAPLFPGEVVVRTWADVLQKRPKRRWAITTSWLASIEGPLARDGRYLVELYRFFLSLAYERPPHKTEMSQIRRDAEANVRRLSRIRSRLADGLALEQPEAEWLEAYRRDERDALALVEAGEARRAAKAREAA